MAHRCARPARRPWDHPWQRRLLLATVPDLEMAAWYPDADALTSPSVKEGFGLAVLEATRAGLRVVTKDLPVIRDRRDPGLGALMAPLRDISAPTTAWDAGAARGVDLVEARHHVTATFSCWACAEERGAMYIGLLAGPAPLSW
jgi:hypothetical protein